MNSLVEDCPGEHVVAALKLPVEQGRLVGWIPWVICTVLAKTVSDRIALRYEASAAEELEPNIWICLIESLEVGLLLVEQKTLGKTHFDARCEQFDGLWTSWVRRIETSGLSFEVAEKTFVVQVVLVDEVKALGDVSTHLDRLVTLDIGGVRHLLECWVCEAESCFGHGVCDSFHDVTRRSDLMVLRRCTIEIVGIRQIHGEPLLGCLIRRKMWVSLHLWLSPGMHSLVHQRWISLRILLSMNKVPRFAIVLFRVRSCRFRQ